MAFGENDWSNQITILHMPRQFSFRGMCKIVIWLDNPFVKWVPVSLNHRELSSKI